MRLLPAVAASALAVLIPVALAENRGQGETGPRVRPALKVTGGVRWLYPGARRPLSLVIGNNRGFPIRVMSLTVRVGDASPGCGHRYIRIGRYGKRLVVSPHGFRTTQLAVRMLPSAPDACKRAVFPLRFSVRGRRA